MKLALPWSLAALSGLCLALAMPGPGIAPLALVFSVLLQEALHRVQRWWQALLVGWLAGTAFWAVTTNWVVPVMHEYGGLPVPFAVGCLLGMGLILGAFWAVAAALTALAPAAWRVWLLPAAWVSVPLLQRLPPFGFTWSGAASAFVDWPWLMGSLPVWGATGLGWWVAATGSGAWGLARSETRRHGLAAVIIAAAALAATVSFAPPPRPVGAPLRVAVLQPGTSLEEKWDPSMARDIADRVWAMTAAAAVRGAELVLWPESALPFRVDTDPSYSAALERTARELEIEIVVNSVASTAGGRFVNSAFLVTPDGVEPARYDKVHLVPFGEFVPEWARFAFTESLVREVGSFTPGGSPVVLQASVPLGVAICFEVVFPDLSAAQVRAGARLLVTLTNDGWYGFSWAPRQHFAQVRLRAAENRRWFARAALTGISGFVDPSGRVVSRLAVGEDGILIEDVQPMDGMTPRTRWGDWWAWVCVAMMVAVMALCRIFRRAEAGERRLR